MSIVKDRPQASPCRHCAGDHQDEVCPHNDESLCEGCGARVEFEDANYCMPCQVDAAEQQGFRWGEGR